LLRWTVLLLLTLNVSYLLWSLLSPEPVVQSPTPWPDSVPALEVLPDNVVARESVSDSGSVPDAVPRIASCWRIGPFTEPQQRAAFVESRLAGIPSAVLEEEQLLEGDWRVFLPPADSREAAIALRESMQSVAAEAGESLESFVMTDGPLENGVSLGLFRQEDNARSLASRAEALGLEVGVERESMLRPVEWVEVMVLPGWMDESRRSGLASYTAGLQVTENLCQTIAPQPYFP
jgi:hypothetical protein